LLQIQSTHRRGATNVTL